MLPVEIAAMSSMGASPSPSRITEPLPNCFSMADTASSIAFSFSGFPTSPPPYAARGDTGRLYRTRWIAASRLPGLIQGVPGPSDIAPPEDPRPAFQRLADAGCALPFTRFHVSVAAPEPREVVGFFQRSWSPDTSAILFWSLPTQLGKVDPSRCRFTVFVASSTV